MERSKALLAEDVEDRKADRKRKSDLADLEVEERRMRLQLQQEELAIRKETNELMKHMFDFMKASIERK